MGKANKLDLHTINVLFHGNFSPTPYSTLCYNIYGKKFDFDAKLSVPNAGKMRLNLEKKNEEITWNFLLAKEAGTDRWVVTTMQEAKANQYWNMVKC